MVGWHLLLLLVVEATLYGAIGWHMHVSRGWTVAQAAGLAVGIYIGVRAVLVAAEFFVARWKGSTIPEPFRVSNITLVVMYLRELAGWILMFTFVMPFVLSRPSVIDRHTVRRSGRSPILLIHGLACNRANWFWFRSRLEQLGYHVFTMDCTPPISRISRYAAQVGCAVDEVLEATGSAKVVLIGHSQGGLAIRAYLDQFGDDKVAQIVTLGSPHRGTWLARLSVGPNAHDMREDSRWIAGLREREAERSANPYATFTCLFTYHDNLVAPQSNAVLQGATVIPLSGIGHLSLALSPLVVKHVVAAMGR